MQHMERISIYEYAYVGLNFSCWLTKAAFCGLKSGWRVKRSKIMKKETIWKLLRGSAVDAGLRFRSGTIQRRFANVAVFYLSVSILKEHT